MSSTLTNNLSREKVQQLLAAVGSKQTEDTTQIEAADYKWNQPHYFNNEQIRKLDSLTKKMATAVSEKFTALCHDGYNVTNTSTTQHFAAEFIDSTLKNGQGNYYLAFGTDQDHLCGFIDIPPQTAVIWVTQLLGDAEPAEGADRALSQLEESLLLDIASAIVEALSESYVSYDFHPAKSIAKDLLSFELKGTEALCKITLRIQKANSETGPEVHLLIPCSKLEPIVGKTTKVDNESTSKDASKVILDHLQKMSVSVTAQLASIELTFEEIMGLQVDDILLLDKKIEEPAELIVEGQPLFRGQLAKSAGKYAVVVTELSCDMM
jgi:flagellar motor switch protein FliM